MAGEDNINALETAGTVAVTGTTSAAVGQVVTLSFAGQTYSATVQSGASGQPNTFSVPIAASALAAAADGSYPVAVNVSNSAGTPAQTVNRTVRIDATAPTVLITALAGESVSAANSTGTFSAAERGDLAVSTVTTPPTISGTTSAEDGQTVTIELGGGAFVYSTAAAAGAWSYTLSDSQARALQHGNSYAVRVTVSDAAATSAAPDTDHTLVVDLATPAAPPVNQQYRGHLHPQTNGPSPMDRT